nr:MAG TPA: tailspike protein [Caudoviricetes sp.]
MSEKDNNVMPLATDPHNLGEFDNVYDAMRRYPNGGVDGDYIYILGVQHFWNVNRQSWGILKDKEDNLVQMVEDFIGLFERRGYVFAGYALPDTTPVSGLDNIFYIAAKNGVYTHFGSDLKLLNEVAILRKPRRSSIWIKDSMDIPNSERIDVIDDAISRINVDIETIKSAIIGMENDLDGVHDSIDDINKDIDAFKKETSENFEEVNSDLDKVEKRLDYIPKESFLSARPAGFKPDIDLTPEITVDRAWRDHEGNVIRDTYITRRGLRNEIIDITNQQVTDLKPGSVDPDDLSEATKQLIGNKSITNLPDEEDITVTDNQTLKLKDKEYAPKDYSGMGRVYLRKHYVNGVNTLTQHMMRKPNTIYIIQYDYCLAGQTIEVPENCVLDFQGGSLRNGCVCGNKTKISSKKDCMIFGDQIEIQGNWKVKNIYDGWFYFNDSSEYVSNNLIKQIFALSDDSFYNVIHFDENRTYRISLQYNGNANLGTHIRPNYAKLYTKEYSFLRVFDVFTSNTHWIMNNRIQMLSTNQGAYMLFYIEDKENITITGSGSILGEARSHSYSVPFVDNSTYYGEYGEVLMFASCNNIILRDLTIGESFGDGIAIVPKIVKYISSTEGIIGPPCKNVEIDNVKILYNRRNGIWTAGHNVKLVNCYFEGNGSDEIRGTAPRCGIDFESDYISINKNAVNKNTVMSNCTFYRNKYDVSSFDCTNEDSTEYGVVINNCMFTAPLRINRTYWLKFNNCYIPQLSSHDNGIGSWVYSKNVVYENCQFGELYPYLIAKAKEYDNKFINCTYPEDTKYETLFELGIDKAQAIKFTFDTPLYGKVDFKVISTMIDGFYYINETKYLLGNTRSSLVDTKIYNRSDTTSYSRMYNKISVLSYPNIENDKIVIYLANGGDIEGDRIDGVITNDIFLSSNIKYSIIKRGESSGSGPAISGNVCSKVSTLKCEIINIDKIPSNVKFPKNEMFKNIEGESSSDFVLPNNFGGKMFYDVNYKTLAIWDSFQKKLVDYDGYSHINRKIYYGDLEGLKSKLSKNDLGISFYIIDLASTVFWVGDMFMNIDGSVFSNNIPIPSKYAFMNFITENNVTYVIKNNIVLEDDYTLNLPNNITLKFDGGTLHGGKIVLDNTKILPNGCILKDFIKSEISGTYAKGQCLYDTTLNKPKWWNGTNWVDATGATV